MQRSNQMSLDVLRAEIDTLDDAILELIEQRLAKAAAIAKSKPSRSGRHLKYRPLREGAILERLIGRAHHATPWLIRRIWRELMGHSLQLQARTELILAGPVDRELMECRVRDHFGSAAPLVWADSAAEALGRACEEEAIAVISGPLPDLDPVLAVGAVINAQEGKTFAWIIGRISPEERECGASGMKDTLDNNLASFSSPA